MAQPGMDEQLAAQYFQQGDYAKAILYYEKLYRRTPNTYYYEQLLKSHRNLNDLEAAEKLVKEQLRRSNGEPRYLIDLGGVYKAAGEMEKAEREYDKALKLIGSDQNMVRTVANAF